MIYGHVPDWVKKENPSFAEAVEKYYSIAAGKKEHYLIGEVAYWRTAIELLGRLSCPIDQLSAEEQPFYLRLKEMVESFDRRMNLAAAQGDYKTLSRLAAAVKYLEKHKEQPELWEPTPLEFVFEAYLFLRQRDGEGSSLPFKQEVKNTAALIHAFHTVGILDKLPKFLWDKSRDTPMAGPELTDKEFSRIDELRRFYTREETKWQWNRLFREAGLRDLPQASREA